MTTLKVTFTDAYGVSHTDAVCALMYGYKNNTAVQTIGDNPSTSQSIVINCQFKYWTSQAAKDAGYQPMLLMSTTGQTMFAAYPTTEAEVADLETYCLNQLTTVILPAIDPNAVIVV